MEGAFAEVLSREGVHTLLCTFPGDKSHEVIMSNSIVVWPRFPALRHEVEVSLSGVAEGCSPCIPFPRLKRRHSLQTGFQVSHSHCRASKHCYRIIPRVPQTAASRDNNHLLEVLPGGCQSISGWLQWLPRQRPGTVHGVFLRALKAPGGECSYIQADEERGQKR
jgi:hypothetical protein